MASDPQIDPLTNADNVPQLPPSPRENMVAAAVNFLKNPKVRQSPFAQRRLFLEQKGLTKEEIGISIVRSGTGSDEYTVSQTPIAQPLTSNAALLPMSSQPAQASVWSRTRDIVATAMVVGGIGYAIYHFYKAFLEPYLFGPSKQEQQMDSVEQTVQELRQNVLETLRLMQDMQGVLHSQQENLQKIMTSTVDQVSDANRNKFLNTNEIKDELKSLKSLLLSRHQFPPTPVSKPVLPEWQLRPPETVEVRQTDRSTPPLNSISKDEASLNQLDPVSTNFAEHSELDTLASGIETRMNGTDGDVDNTKSGIGIEDMENRECGTENGYDTMNNGNGKDGFIEGEMTDILNSENHVEKLHARKLNDSFSIGDTTVIQD